MEGRIKMMEGECREARVTTLGGQIEKADISAGDMKRKH
jgi:hypothetical protein